MPDTLRIFISHSSDDGPLADKVAAALAKLPGVQVMLDRSGLDPGQPWRRELHEWLARCNAGLVLLTDAVLGRPKWVLKESIILGWRKDLERDFPLFFAFGPGRTRQEFQKKGFELAQLADTQHLAGAAHPKQAAALVKELARHMPSRPADTPYDDLTRTVSDVMRVADPSGTTYKNIAAHLGLTTPANYGPDKLAQLADEVARAVVRGRDQQLGLDTLMGQLVAWGREPRDKWVKLLAPFWVDPQAAGELMRHVPPKGQSARAALVIAGQRVPGYTAEMYVRRAYGLRTQHYKPLERAISSGKSKTLDDLRHAVCELARNKAWVDSADAEDEEVMDELLRLPSPAFVALTVLPDAPVMKALRASFPRLLFIAPKPLGGARLAAVGAVELLPEPPPGREEAEYIAYDGARNAIASL